MCFGCDVFVNKLANFLLQCSMRIIVVWISEFWTQPNGFGVRHWAQIARALNDDFRLLSFDCSNTQTLIFGQNLLAMKIVEVSGSVFAGDLLQHNVSTGMRIEEVGQIINFV